MSRDDLYDQVNRLLNVVGRRDSLERFGNIKEAIRLADAAGDESLATELRCLGAEAAIYCRRAREGMVMHSWVLGKIDENRELRDQFLERVTHNDMLLAQSVAPIAEISREEIDELFGQLADRRREAGDGVLFVQMAHLVALLQMGDEAEADKVFEVWRRDVTNSFEDCHTCTDDLTAYYWMFKGEHEKAEEVLGDPMTPRLCASDCYIPAMALSRSLGGLARAGRWDDAAKLYASLAPRIEQSPGDYHIVGMHLLYLARRHHALGEPATELVKLLRRTFEKAFLAEQSYRLICYLAAVVAICPLLRAAGVDKLVLSRKGRERTEIAGRIGSVDDLEREVEAELVRIARSYDERNGNDYHMGIVADAKAWHDEPLRPFWFLG